MTVTADFPQDASNSEQHHLSCIKESVCGWTWPHLSSLCVRVRVCASAAQNMILQVKQQDNISHRGGWAFRENKCTDVRCLEGAEAGVGRDSLCYSVTQTVISLLPFPETLHVPHQPASDSRYIMQELYL